MIDLFTIFSKGGIVLWYFQGTTQLLTNSVNELIKNVILQERGLTAAWNYNSLALKYKLDNEFDLVFVVAYQNILKLSYIDKFLTDIQLEFRDKYKQDIQHANYSRNFDDFKLNFDNILKECEIWSKLEASKVKQPRSYHETEKAQSKVSSMIEKKTNVLPFGILGTSEKPQQQQQQQKVKLVNGEDRNIAEEKPEQVESQESVELPVSPRGIRMKKFEKAPKAKVVKKDDAPVKKVKKPTSWDGDQIDYKDLDFSNNKDKQEDAVVSSTDMYADKGLVGGMKGELKGFEVQDESESDEDDNAPVINAKQPSKTNGKGPKASSGSLTSGFFSSIKSLVGAKVLNKETIEPVMEKMQEHLVTKNVAAEIAKKLCDNVAFNLEGKQAGSFQSVTTIVKQALNDSLVQILTAKRRIDILRDVLDAQKQQRPYVIVFCGVNGVGKSTNLAKITFWLIENSYRVLIAACDTFRAGAVEQLRTHTKHLNSLHPPEMHNGQQMVQLYEKGYGKDAAGIAMEAINYARDSHIDVVLVDTAGRMQDNEPLMKALAKLININQPDLVLFVGEALVGNEAVDQVRKFNQALADNSTISKSNDQARLIDGIVLTKFDTIDDKVGAAISMTYTTGQPIVFVGTGQKYADLKTLNAKSVVQSLLK